MLAITGLRTRSDKDEQGQRIPGSAEWGLQTNKPKADEEKKNALDRQGLRQRTLNDELGERIPGSARWWGERRTPDEQEVAKNMYNRRYDNIRQGVGEGKTTALSARTAVVPPRSATLGLGAWPNNVAGPQGPGGPSALAAARHNLERGETARRGEIDGRRWDQLSQRITNRMTGGPNPLLDQVKDAGVKRDENSSIAKTYGRKNRDTMLALGPRVNNVPHHVQQHTIHPNLLTPISNLTKTGLGAPSQRVIQQRRGGRRFRSKTPQKAGGKRTRHRTRHKKRRKSRKKKKSSRKRKSRKRGGGKGEKGETKTMTPDQAASRIQAVRRNQTRRRTRQVIDKTTDLPKHLQHLILKKSYPSVATGMYTGPDRNDLNRRMSAMTSITQGVRNRLTTQVVLPGFPLGTLMTADNIAEIMHNNALDDAQDKEVRRLVARLYTNPVDGYTDDWIFGTGAFNSKMAAHVGTHVERKQHRQNLLANGNINDRTINNDNLPLPLQILRKNRRFNQPISDRYPHNDDGSVDETHDVFWPINRREFDFYMKTFPTLDEITFYGW